MRLRSTAAVVVLTAAVTLPLTGTALAADRDCKDFSSQAAAQAALVPGDPERLDANGNGQACEDFAYAAVGAPASAPTTTQAGGQVAARPAGAVAAGDGSTSTASAAETTHSPVPYVLGGLAFSAAAGASLAARRARARG